MFKSKHRITFLCLFILYQRGTFGKSISNNGTVNTTQESSSINFIRCRAKYFNTGCFVEGKNFLSYTSFQSYII